MIGRLLERGNFDDTKEAIEKRCANFQNQTRPVLAKYEAKLVKVLSLIVIMLSYCISLLPRLMLTSLKTRLQKILHQGQLYETPHRKKRKIYKTVNNMRERKKKNSEKHD